MGRIALFGEHRHYGRRSGGHPAREVTRLHRSRMFPRPFEISYSDKPVAISRQADVAQWCVAHAIPQSNMLASTSRWSISGTIRLISAWSPAGITCCRAACAPVSPGGGGPHASRLPELRGGAPLNWAILAGFERTAVTLFALGDGVDDGPVYGQEATDVGPNDYIGELVARCNAASVVLVERCISGILDGSLVPAVQDGVASYGAQRSPEDGVIDQCCAGCRDSAAGAGSQSPLSGCVHLVGWTPGTDLASRRVPGCGRVRRAGPDPVLAWRPSGRGNRKGRDRDRGSRG